MNRILIAAALAGLSIIATGCSTKNYARQQTTPLINKTNELDDITAQSSRDIKDWMSARKRASLT